ncbi:MAG: C10 family peptidase [Prevotella sp.]|nr:C10 family peptidase [Prevotella sp.]
MKKLLLSMTMLAFVNTIIYAVPRSLEQMKTAARQAINQQLIARHLAPSNAPLKVLKSVEQVSVIGNDDSGFAVIAADDLLPAVLGVSTARYSYGKNPNFEWWFKATAETARNMVKNNAPMRITTPDPAKYPEEVLPMVTTKWYQTEPYNNMCPTFSGTTKCLTGCVATAMAQVLNYHETPEHGVGARTIYYPQRNTNGEAVTANFEEDYYDWLNMRDIYVEGEYSEEEANAVALLMRDCGVAADMQYGGPSEGSGAYSTDAADGLRKYFGFEDALCLMRDDYDEPEWMDIIYSELNENGPVYYGGSSYFSGGHAFLFDGYNAEGMVSVNWGWAGQDDGYFYVNHLEPSGSSFNMGQDMIVGIKSNKHSRMRSENVKLTEEGQLQKTIEENDTIENSFIGTLTVEGPLNSDDLAFLRHLAGWDVNGEPTEGRLRVLDLSKATLQGNTLPDSIFKNCTTMRNVKLPESIKAIGSEAFYGCTGLIELRVNSKKIPSLLGNGVFEGVPFGSTKLYVYSGLKTKYLQAAQWSEFGEQNIYQIGTSVKVRNAIRYYGEKNPDFYYNVTGDDVKGEPKLSCEATQWSPAGKYPIHISAGSIANPELVNFIDGYIIVRKIEGAIATVADAEREEGEPNPEFTMTYTGLLSHDTEPTWLTEPVFKTDADENSRPGVYSIEVESGEPESYAMTFVAGKLTVTAKPVPNGISNVNDDNCETPVYNLQGQRVNVQRKGLFIRNGKKVVK